ncbi:translation elongation factor Ts [Psychromonas sp. 14N.309.X.WAT.B.A12]|jgi:elongation factor Ts|uniref:translation elongation factor Ts n=1 Tax=unclassified Psychromonas TaxID=2614957 RepID=UPI0025AFF192|nr:translation elongation factor Ts [Psychromonas sp. 14N.309.X.WAT.B.A12]MDN2662893.1 translation elongation factor Ts [Psychromonas sp. 14N.309.X.WAT.B.A12]
MAITAQQVKELRDRTAAGMMDCKKALVEADGDIELAIENMRKSGAIKAAKKAGRIAAEGAIFAKTDGTTALIIEVNCETDFVAMDKSFLAFAEKTADIALANKVDSVETLNALAYDDVTVDQARENLVAKIGENISVRRLQIVEGENLGAYVHSRKIGVISVLTGGDAELAKDIAMHVAAAAPQFVKPEDVPADVVAKEKEIQLQIAIESGKPAEIAEKMVNGRMAKFTGEVSLTGQSFIKDPSISVAKLLKGANADVVSFVRLEVGEGIEKKEEDFAAEVAATMAAAK